MSNIAHGPDRHTIGAILLEEVPQVYGNHQLFPVGIMILHDGRYERELQGNGSYVWRWIFWNGGKQIAAGTSLLRSGQDYSLIDVATGRLIDQIAPGQDPRAEDWDSLSLHAGAMPGPAEKTRMDCRFARRTPIMLRISDASKR